MPWRPAYRERQAALWAEWDAEVEAAYHPPSEVTDALAEGLLTQGQVLGAVNELTDPRDVVLCAAGSMPGDLHKLWRVRDRKAYHVEYGYSCMGYEVPASIGIRLADESRDVFAMVGDGGYLMMPTELVTAVQERVKVIVVLVQNHGFHSIGSLSESLGSQRFGTQLPLPRREDRSARGRSAARRPRRERPQPRRPRHRGALAGRSSSRRSRRPRRLPPTVAPSSSTSRPTRSVYAPDSNAWWDVPVSEVSELDSTQAAYAEYTDHKSRQRPLLGPAQSASVYRKTGEEK